MEQSVAQLFSEELIHKAGQSYGADTKEYKKLGDFESYIFEVTYKGQPTILRLTHSSHRSSDQIEAELEWVNYLHQNGVNVSKPFYSNEGSYVVTLSVEDSFFYASLFEKAPERKLKFNQKCLMISSFMNGVKVQDSFTG